MFDPTATGAIVATDGLRVEVGPPTAASQDPTVLFPGGDVLAGTDPTDLLLVDVDRDGAQERLVIGDGASAAGPALDVLEWDGARDWNLVSQPVLDQADPIVATGDFDGDGFDDLVRRTGLDDLEILVVRAGGPVVAWQLQVGVIMRDAAAADFDLDGNVDLVVLGLDNFVPTLEVYLNDGTGALSLSASRAVTGSPFSVAAGDLNGDGAPDAIVSSTTSATLGVVPGDGAGGLGAVTAVSAGGEVEQLALHDMDADGDLDVVVRRTVAATPSKRRIDVHLNAGALALPVGSSLEVDPHEVFDVGDVDGDGLADVLIGSSRVAVCAGSGAGVLAAAVPTGPALGAVIHGLGDVDNDGDLDVVATSLWGPGTDFSLGGVFTLLGDGAGNFVEAATPVYPAGPVPLTVVAGDFDRDGVDDLVVGSNTGLALHLGLGDGAFASGVGIPGSPPAPFGRSFEAVDVDGDGNLDLVSDVIWLGDGAGAFTPSSAAVGIFLPWDLVVAQIDGAGGPDIASLGWGELRVHLSSGPGTFATPVVLAAPPSARCVAAGDIDGDGDVDLVVGSRDGVWQSQGPGSHSISVYENTGAGAFDPVVTYEGWSRASDIAVGDVNGDGFGDVVVVADGITTSGGQKGVSVLLGASDASLTLTGFDLNAGSPSFVRCVDLDGDLRDEIVLVDRLVSLDVHDVSPLGLLSPRAGFYAGLQPEGVAVLDANGDRIPDLATIDRALDEVRILVNRLLD